MLETSQGLDREKGLPNQGNFTPFFPIRQAMTTKSLVLNEILKLELSTNDTWVHLWNCEHICSAQLDKR